MDTDILDNILSLEEQFYKEGYDLGVIDGARAGYTEGSVFAVEKSFEKLLQLGRLYGRALVWNQRLISSGVNEEAETTKVGEGEDSITTDMCNAMPPLHQGSRLAKNIQTLLALVDPATLVLQNTEDAVSEIEERLKGASLKVKLIQRALGETSFGDSSAVDGFAAGEGKSAGDGSGSIEDISSLHVRH
ncbi:nuclear pore complex protein [Talaromyces pinophilus]|jgi:mRNA export factor|uniref:Nuclear pore complex protein n=1 Tax=Talaromyces pinophilus TaxID=128442 RepID=A0A6V8HNM8_TALPI|nr:nuclear pore complex protein [Talaromyces pinophilus]